jgi:predicted alternative tryptophan synthase beta-subunit
VAGHAALSRAAAGKALDTPAHIYYKYEGTSPAGSHKPNTAVAQAYYNKRAGIKRLATETGAGSGAAPWRWPAGCSTWNARSTWCASATTRNLTAA